jgi:ABC-type transport system involved in multi-copper enzyme maturation permease subunit
MANRVGLGPVFVYESLILARRWQAYAGRAVFILVVLIGLSLTWWSTAETWAGNTPGGSSAGVLQALARVGENFFYTVAGIQLTVLFLVAPAATAGAICQDRAQGILTQMAVTDLSSAEIVLGKLGSRTAPVLALLACMLPVTALATLLGGIDPQAVFGLFGVSVAVVVLGCALALAISLWAVKTHEVIMAVILLWAFWLLSLPIWESSASSGTIAPPPDWFRKANPVLLVYSPYTWPNYVSVWDVVGFIAGALLISAFLAALTIARFRSAVLFGQAAQFRKSRLHAILDVKLLKWLEWLPGPSLDGNPVFWREWHRNRPGRLARIVWAAYALAAIAGTAFGFYDAFRYGVDVMAGGSPALILAATLQVPFGLLLLAVMAPTSLAEERIRGSLDVLLTTPLSTRSIVWGKWLGTYRTVFLLTILPTLGAVGIAYVAPPLARSMVTAAARARFATAPLTLFDRVVAPGLVACEMLSYGAAITSLGLALATWIPRLGRAVAANVLAFVAVGIGWPILFEAVFWRWITNWFWTRWGIQELFMYWFSSGMVVASPFAAAQVTLTTLIYHYGSSRVPFWCCAFTWTVLAATFAGLTYWATLKTFDRYLGRMLETSVETAKPYRRVVVRRPAPMKALVR